jgi:ATP-dependent DNA helicase RecG
MTDNEYIQSLLRDKEGNQLEFIESFNYKRIAETVCAFLNTQGGRILVGVNPKKELVLENEISEEFNELRRFIYDAVIPESLIGIRKEEYKSRPLVLIEVIEGTTKPYSVTNQSFIRAGNETRPANENEMSNLIRARRKEEYSWENSPALEASLDDLDKEEISQAIMLSNNIGRTSRFTTDDPLTFLTHFQLFRNSQLTNAAIVLFGKDPTYFLPQCRVRIIYFGESKSVNEYADTLIVEENLFKSFRKIQDYFKKNLPIQSQFSDADWQRKDQPKYPVKALDEAVINAMMHRDYSDPTGEVFVGIYSEKIEVINSGELPESLKDVNLKRSHRSIPPNPVITHMVYLCGMIEKVGRGTVLITELFDEYGLDEPHWKSKNGGTTLTLPGKAKTIELNERMQSFIQSIDEGQQFGREDYERFFQNNISEKTARLDIGKLVDGKWLEKTGEGPATKYLRTYRKLPDGTMRI